jgi:hypothetical protein
MLGNFNAKVGREDIFKPTTRKDTLHEISNDNRVAINSATSNNLTVKSIVFPHCIILNLLGLLLVEKLTINLTIF